MVVGVGRNYQQFTFVEIIRKQLGLRCITWVFLILHRTCQKYVSQVESKWLSLSISSKIRLF